MVSSRDSVVTSLLMEDEGIDADSMTATGLTTRKMNGKLPGLIVRDQYILVFKIPSVQTAHVANPPS